MWWLGPKYRVKKKRGQYHVQRRFLMFWFDLTNPYNQFFYGGSKVIFNTVSEAQAFVDKLKVT